MLTLLKEKAKEINEKDIIKNIDNEKSVCEYKINKDNEDYNEMNKCERINIRIKSRSNYKFSSSD